MLLDTCALLWLSHDHSRFTSETLDRIDASPVVCVSAISGFEIGLKYRAGKLRLPIPPSQWIEAVVRHHHIDVVDITLDIAVKTTELPPVHKDPCDRFIIATALTLDLPIVTTDARFSDYGVTVII